MRKGDIAMGIGFRRVLLIGAVILACSCKASLVRGTLGWDGQVFIGEEESSAGLYIQDGLVALYDGIENVGFGKHNNASMIWVDLSGNGNYAVKSGNAPFDYNCATFDGSTYYVSVDGIDFGGELTWDIFADQAGSQGNADYVTWTIGGGGKLGRALYNIRGSNTLRVLCGTGESTAYFGWNYSSKVGLLDVPTTITLFEGDALFGLYCDGELKYQHSKNIPLTAPNEKNIVIGANKTVKTKVPNNIMCGRIYCVRLYNRQLSSAEIAYNRMVDQARFGL